MEKQNQIKIKKKIVGQLELGKTIGKGTFATVKEATHLPTQQKVAVKVINKKLIVDVRDKTNVSRELKIIEKLRHPNIAQLLQIMESNSKIYLVLEHVDGGELYELIINSKNNRLTEEQASVFLQQLLNTVQYLHSLGITHRDIKPENIMITKHNTIKLIDFGLSNYYQPHQQLTTSCGSPCYAAPEMLSKQPYSPLKAEMWSCGVVLYTMLCGFLPFQAEQTSQIYKLIQKGTYEEPSHLSSNAKSILKNLLHSDPDTRATISQLRKHPFCKMFEQPIIKGLLPSHKILIDFEIMEEMKTLGYKGFAKDIEENNKNQNTTAFYLLLLKKLDKENISCLTYYKKILQLKSPFKIKPQLFKNPSNPEQLPQISKKTNIISMANLKKLFPDLQKSNGHKSTALLKNPSRSINIRIKKMYPQ